MDKKHNKLLHKLKHLKRGNLINNNWTEESPRPRDWESIYRNRWQHDKVVRSTHGVNCTGSCSWKIYVKDGIVTQETQQIDYPSTGDNFPQYEPRGCPRGASYSWYTYSPTRVKYPYIRKDLYELWENELEEVQNPVQAWENIVNDREKRQKYIKARGKGGFIRGSWKDICQMIAASSIYTIKKYGPDRIAGFSPIPAMSMISYAGGTRFLSLIGGTIISFYDWYADLPPASPQVWGDQTDVPESADWYNSKYFIIWGTNLPQTRTPDAHFMVESRYAGTKVVGVSPDYAEYEKFADMWLPAKEGTDGALAMAMTHVILKEFYVDREVPYFTQYVKQYTDLPFLVQLKDINGSLRADNFLRAADLSSEYNLGDWKTVVWDENTQKPVVPIGSAGHQWDGKQNWNLELEDESGNEINPILSFIDISDNIDSVDFPHFATKDNSSITHKVPTKVIKDKNGNDILVTTVYDLMMAHTSVDRGLDENTHVTYDDSTVPYTPAWQEGITGVKKEHVIQVAREFAQTAELTKGKAMIAMGGGTNHWYHSDQIYRAILNIIMLCGTEGVNGGGWAHYVGQEKVRPSEGFAQVAFANDWKGTPRHMNGTSYFYFATDQFRYESDEDQDNFDWGGKFSNMHPADFNALSVRLGWLPGYPQLTENSLDVISDARKRNLDDAEAINDIAKQLAEGELNWAIENPDDERTFPKVFFNWRSNLLGDSGKGHEYFVKHMIGGDDSILTDTKNSWQPKNINLNDTPAEGKVDLLISMDFRMTSSGLFSDIVLPAATWYEKNDLSSTDMHPFVHPFNQAITPPWETKSDWDAFREIARTFSELAKDYLPKSEDLVMQPLGHDTKSELAQPYGKVKDWRKGEVEAIPGQTMPNFAIVERDYPNLYDMWSTIGPNLKNGYGAKGVKIPGQPVYDELLKRLGKADRKNIGKGLPDMRTAKQACNAILLMSGTTNGKRAVEGWKSLKEKTGKDFEFVSKGREEEDLTLDDITVQPRQTISTPVWTGLENDGRRYSPFTSNVEFKLPWHTLTGRQSFYLDHEVMLDYGEGLPLYIPPLYSGPYLKNEKGITDTGKSIKLRYLTPHQKWGIHTMFTDTDQMTQLFRGWQTVWLNEDDANSIGIYDNDWIELYNRNGAVVARAVTTYRIPQGVAYMHHAQDRVMGVPGNTINKKRGGTHNSVTRIHPKGTHMIGGYAQLSYGFNYYGPTGNQRDTVSIVRPLKEVDWLED